MFILRDQREETGSVLEVIDPFVALRLVKCTVFKRDSFRPSEFLAVCPVILGKLSRCGK